MEGKIIIVSAPSGCGKSTIINRLLQKGEIDMEFSVSATNRAPRNGETHGVNYASISPTTISSSTRRSIRGASTAPSKAR